MDTLSTLARQRVLVTGGSGFIGRHVLERGVELGARVVAVGRRDPEVEGAEHLSVDLQDAAGVRDAVLATTPSMILHLASAGVSYGRIGFEEMLAANVMGLHHLVTAAAELPVQPVLVVAGSGYEYAPQGRPLTEADPIAPTSAYGVSKAAATISLSASARAMSVTVLRPFNVYGPGEREPRLVPHIVGSALRNERVELTAGEQIRDYVYVKDAAESFWRSLSVPAAAGVVRVLNVGSGAPESLRSFVERLLQILIERGLRPRVEFGIRPYRPDEPMVYAADVSRLHSELSWRPTTPPAVGLLRTVESLL